MTTQTAEPRIAKALQKRILQFYDHFNRGDFGWCYRAIDPVIREKEQAIPLAKYALSLGRFLDWYGGVKDPQFKSLRLHLQEPNLLHNNRDFALGQLAWEDQFGQTHTFTEHWVRGRFGLWYTCAVGLVTPGAS